MTLTPAASVPEGLEGGPARHKRQSPQTGLFVVAEKPPAELQIEPDSVAVERTGLIPGFSLCANSGNQKTSIAECPVSLATAAKE